MKVNIMTLTLTLTIDLKSYN